MAEDGTWVDRHMSYDASDDDSCGSDDDDYDAYDDYNDMDGQFDGDDEVTLHPLLEHDLEMAKVTYGSQQVSIRTYGVTDDLDIELSISMTFLDGDIADAWKIKRDEPLIIRLHMNASQYLDAIEPKVEVFQPSQKERFGVGSQMRKILEGFISEQWKSLSNELVIAKQPESCRMPQPPPRKRRFWPQLSVPEAKKKQSPPCADGPPFSDSSIAKLTDMGFSANMSRNALTITRGDEQEAANILLSHPDWQLDKQGGIIGNSTGAIPGDSSPDGADRPSRPPRVKTQQSLPKTTGPRQWLPALFGGEKKEDTGDFLQKVSRVKNPKEVPGVECGFLVMLMRYAVQRLGTLNEFCVVCDRQHVFTHSGMLKPTVCARELCVFAFQTLGVMSDAADDIATGSEVVDLLIAMAKAACFSKRKELIFDPFPTIVDPNNHSKVALTPKHRDFKRAEEVLNSFPPMSCMVDLVGAELKKVMDSKDALAYPLLQWIITSNRSHIVKLPPEKQLSFMRTPHQYLLLSSPPAQEAAFQEAKVQYGSTYAFHGSHIENWHSIIREGLVNASGTRRQMHGSAYGAGIYLSPHSNVSFTYSGMGSRYSKVPAAKPKPSTGPMTRFLKSHNLTCITLCEVITNKDLRKNGSIWVMPNPDYVTTRFFFVYEDGQYGDETIDTEGPGYKKEILKALGYHAS